MTTILFTKTCRRDLPLAEYQAKLIAKFWRNAPPHVYVADDFAEVRELAAHIALHSAINPVRAANNFDHAPEGWASINGYLRQQMTKLLAPRIAADEGFICSATFQIDADCMPCAPFDWNDFVPSWLYYPKPVWPVPHVAAQIPGWSKTSRELVENDHIGGHDDWTFMAGLGWWVPNEVADFIVARLSSVKGGLVEAFKEIQAKSIPFSEYQTIGRVMYRAEELGLGRAYSFRRGITDLRGRPQFAHIPLQPGGRDVHLSPPDKARLEELLRGA